MASYDRDNTRPELAVWTAASCCFSEERRRRLGKVSFGVNKLRGTSASLKGHKMPAAGPSSQRTRRCRG